MNQGYIRLHRKIEEWDWYKNPNVLVLWIHILMKANYEDKKWQGQIIKRGSFITGLHSLSNETGLSMQQTRTALNKLQLTNNITSKTTNKYRIITVLNYDDYQRDNNQTNKQSTSKLTNNLTIKQQTNNNNEVIKEIKKEISNKKTKAKKEYFSSPQLNDLFLDFLDLRKQLKAKNTDRAINTIINKLNELSDSDKIKCINASIESSWKTVYTDKYKKKQTVNHDQHLFDYSKVTIAEDEDVFAIGGKK